ncbi:MAG: hypothetical protein JOY80_04975 [Candidatus Dormibacteraeota bacterium]|nr:hypothetical protein [Candidatus Dormibacteraeota bacterium]
MPSNSSPGSRAIAAARTLVDLAADKRHPLAPSAVRVERSSAHGDRGQSHQTALTVWFGQGPSLPIPGGGGPSMRTVVGAVAGFAGVVALGALGVIASQREPHALREVAPLPRIAPGPK